MDKEDRGIDRLIIHTHPELLGKLRQAAGRPVMITVTYLDVSKRNTTKRRKSLEHWQGTNRDFPDGDIVGTLRHLLERAEAKLGAERKSSQERVKVMPVQIRIPNRRRPVI